MTKFDELQQTHQRLLDRTNDLTDEAAFVREVQDYVARVCEEAADVPNPRDRDQLRANLRYWASYLYDITGTYPKTTMRPARSPLPESESSLPPGTANSSFRFMVIGLSVVLMLLLVLLGLIFLSRQGERVAIEAQNQAIQATNEAINVLIQATNTAVAATLMAPTNTPVPANTASPSRTPAPTETPTATPAIVVPATSQVIAPSEGEIPLNVGYQVLTQGPSPFDPTVWVIHLKLVGMGGNGHYIYWLNGQQLDDDEITVQGARCEPQTITIGVTSNDQAVKQDVTLSSPLHDCLTSGPR